MIGLVEHVYRLRRLTGRCEAGYGLDIDGVHELTGLEAAFPPGHRTRRFERQPVELESLVRRGERSDLVSVLDLGPGGLRCRDLPRARFGDRFELSLPGDTGEVSYRFAAIVAWVKQSDEGNEVGLRFVGTPLRMRHGAITDAESQELPARVGSVAA